MQKMIYGFVGLLVGVGLGVAVCIAYSATTPSMPAMEMSAMDMSMADGSTEMGAMHMHPPRSVPADLPIPSLTHLVFPDAMDGYNVQILLTNFRFTPAAINTGVKDNEGHAHIYVNGIKIGRVYAAWYHLPSDLFKAGENQVTVTLNANDHSEWAVGDMPISSTVIVMKSEETQ
jgi:hypothetical protein